MKRIGLVILLLSVFSAALMTGCKADKQGKPAAAVSQTAPAAAKK